MTTPYLDVAHLPSATSFFSSVLQPLGCYYTSPGSDLGSVDSVQFVRADGVPFLTIRRHPTPGSPLCLSNLTIAAPSKDALVAFHDRGLEANPVLYFSKIQPFSQISSRNASLLSSDESRAMLHDLEGNRLEAVFPHPRPGDGNVQYDGQSVRETKSTQKQVSRILDWNYNVASAAPRSSPQPIESARRRQETPLQSTSPRHSPMGHTQHGKLASSAASVMTESNRKTSANEKEESGISATTVVGALLGVAAGAGVLYSMFGGSKDETSRTKEQPYASRVHQLDQKSTIDDLAHREYIYAGGKRQESGVCEDRGYYVQERSKPRSFVDPWQKAASPPQRHYESTPPITRAIEYQQDRRSSHSSRYNGGRSSESRARSVDRNAGEQSTRDLPDPVPRSSSRQRDATRNSDRNHHVPSRRGSIVADPEHRPLETSRGCAITRYANINRHADASGHVDVPAEHHARHASDSRRSSVAHGEDARHHRSSRKGSTTGEPERNSRTESRHRSRSRARDFDHESYVSARTHRTSSTPRPPLSRPPPSDHEPSRRRHSRAASRSSGVRTPKATTPDEAYGHPSKPSSYVSARNIALPNSEISARCVPVPMSDVSARHVPLPMSGVGSSHANWDDDLVSLAPDDSISCVGTKRARSRRRR